MVATASLSYHNMLGVPILNPDEPHFNARTRTRVAFDGCELIAFDIAGERKFDIDLDVVANNRLLGVSI